MKYKVGDKVRIKSIDWYNENKDEYGYVRFDDFIFTPIHSKYCGCEFTISSVYELALLSPAYTLKGNGYEWTDEMIEGLVEEETYDFLKTDISDSTKLDVALDILARTVILSEGKVPDGYILKDESGNVINARKITLEKKKKEYPKTYVECAKILDCFSATHIDGYKNTLLEKLQELLICRDAYWKIAGEEMGLRRPWKPDYYSLKTKYTIVVVENKVVKLDTLSQNHILTFPTEEMRDAFYENFKEEIEKCKELL